MVCGRKSVVVVQRSCGLTYEEFAGTRSLIHIHTLAVLSPFTSVSYEATADTSASLFLASRLQDASTYVKMPLSRVALLALDSYLSYLLINILNSNRNMLFEMCLFLCICRKCRSQLCCQCVMLMSLFMNTAQFGVLFLCPVNFFKKALNAMFFELLNMVG